MAGGKSQMNSWTALMTTNYHLPCNSRKHLTTLGLIQLYHPPVRPALPQNIIATVTVKGEQSHGDRETNIVMAAAVTIGKKSDVLGQLLERLERMEANTKKPNRYERGTISVKKHPTHKGYLPQIYLGSKTMNSWLNGVVIAASAMMLLYCLATLMLPFLIVWNQRRSA